VGRHSLARHLAYSTRRHCCSISAELVSVSYRPALLLDEQFVLELSSCQLRSERTDMATFLTTHFLSITAVGRSQLLAGRLELTPRFYRRVQRATQTALGVYLKRGWLGSRVASVLDSGAEGPGFKSQPRRCRVTVLGKLFTPVVPLFTNQ